jgi:hypothetical protein
MDLSSFELDWPNIIVGAIISVLIASLTKWIFAKLQWSRGYLTTQRKNTALKRMKLVHELKTDQQDKVLYVGTQIVLVIFFAAASIILLVAGYRLEPHDPWMSVVAVSFAIVGLLLLLLTAAELSHIASAYNNWDEYQKRMQDKFGITVANAKRHGVEKGERKSN